MSELTQSERTILLELLVGERGRCNALMGISGIDAKTLAALQNRMICAAKLQLKLIRDELQPVSVKDAAVINLIMAQPVMGKSRSAPDMTGAGVVVVDSLSEMSETTQPEKPKKRHGGGRPKGYVVSEETKAKIAATRAAKKVQKEQAYARRQLP